MNEIAPIITAISALVISVGTMISIILNYRIHGRMELLEKNTNSIKDALVETTAAKSFAEGVKSEMDKR